MTRRSWLPAVIALSALVLSLWGFPVQAEEGPAFSLKPVRYDPARPETQSYFVYDAWPGQVIHDEVLVRNTGSAPGTVRLYAVDATTGQTSGTVFLLEGDPRIDVGAWITLDEDQLTLAPGEERVVSFTITVPQHVRPGHHVGGLVAQDVEIKRGVEGGTVRIDLQTRTAIAVQVNLPGPVVEAVSINGVTAEVQHGQQWLRLGLRNDGTVMVRPHGTLAVFTPDGRDIARLPLQLDTLLPETEIQYPVPLTGQPLEPGEYRVRVDLIYGERGATQYEGLFTITPEQAGAVTTGQEPVMAIRTVGGRTVRLSSWGLVLALMAGLAFGSLLALAGMKLRARTHRPARPSAPVVAPVVASRAPRRIRPLIPPGPWSNGEPANGQGPDRT